MAVWKGEQQGTSAAAPAIAGKSQPMPTLGDLRAEFVKYQDNEVRLLADLDRHRAAGEALLTKLDYWTARESFGRAFERAVDRTAKARGASKLEVVTLLTDALDAIASRHEQDDREGEPS